MYLVRFECHHSGSNKKSKEKSMKVHYRLKIDRPQTHMVHICLESQRKDQETELEIFMPSWSPGSYLMREYARHIRTLKAFNSKGEVIHCEQVDKATWKLDWRASQLKFDDQKFYVEYEVYCHDLTVRSSHVNREHAFIHGPSVFMGVVGKEMMKPTLEVQFPPTWSKISTGLKDISDKRELFLYQAQNYDELLDCPLEIGCHETDGFLVQSIPHELAFTGRALRCVSELKADMLRIVEHISKAMGQIPYERYVFMTHFAPKIYGGLEHSNSTALHFDGMVLQSRKDYIQWLGLVSHEYFHTWNVKRIRPKELGPFDYRKEAYSTMLWLAEGLTSLMDDLFIYQCGLITLEEYLELQKSNLNKLLSIAGRRFHTLEQSSFNAWIKLYRPDENTKNSSVSYYLKGGIAFFMLNVLLDEQGKHIQDLIKRLWDDYQNHPKLGIDKAQFMKMLQDLAGEQVCETFDVMLSTTEEIDFEYYLNKMGIEVVYENATGADLGVSVDFIGDRVIINSVELDAAAYRSGLNAADEIIAINGMRVLRDQLTQLDKNLLPDTVYTFTVSRLNQIHDVEVIPLRPKRIIKNLEVRDLQKVQRVLKGSMPMQ